MAKNGNISTSVIKRLPRYYRFLGELDKQGVERISSRELSERMNLTASQIRQDLNCFGGFGQQGYGYHVASLRDEIGHILGVDKEFPTILIGAGNLGKAIAMHINFGTRGCRLAGIFDANPRLTGETVGSIAIRHTDEIEEFCKDEHPVIAVLCIPKANTQAIADKLVELGIKSFWNFSHYDLTIDHKGIEVENVHLGDSLLTLTYRTNQLGKAEEE
ncbi:redox-sensing transcriptional repressor Rex [Ruminococcus albus]|uniref:Redox-sensing transcriptional repressor Rex n=1 Tax=Ruminococcus albus TaxID=1264 RepID=A0A1H7PGC1_RUMAL|nr:redox-sensing transcriptional repressor Rex [Ruminococcus albus]SEL34504.1 redox-sensing transcriptional repressor [Ruminococcus albus]